MTPASKPGAAFPQRHFALMTRHATSQDVSAAALQPSGRLSPSIVLAAALVFGSPATSAFAGDVTFVAAAPAALGPVVQRSVTIILRTPVKVVEGDRVALQSMLRFSGRAWEAARIEILANGVVVSRTTAMRGGLWYTPRTPIAAGDYEFAARATSPDGTREVSDVLRITVSPPILLDPESLAGKSVYSVG